MAVKGIDVSKWQGNIDFNKVKAAGISFVIIRAGYGAGNKDNWFEENYRKAKAAGLDVGAYWYSYAASVEGARQEAVYCANVLAGKQFEYPVYFDMEEKSQIDKGINFCSGIITAFCNELEKRGYFAGFYGSLSKINSVVSTAVRNRYTVWVAQWNDVCTYNGAYGIWQYSSNGSINGINGRVDLDYAYIDFPSIIKSKGLNGYKASGSTAATTTTAKKSVDELAHEVINGKWGNGTDRKNRLTAAGYDYSAVQARVNAILNSIKVGDTVKVTNAVTYTGQSFKLWYSAYEVMGMNGDRAVIGVNGVVTAAVNVKNLKKA